MLAQLHSTQDLAERSPSSETISTKYMQFYNSTGCHTVEPLIFRITWDVLIRRVNSFLGDEVLLMLTHKLLFESVLNTEMSLFKGIGIEEFPHFRKKVPLYLELSSFQGVGIERFHCIQRCPHFRELKQRAYRSVLISGG